MRKQFREVRIKSQEPAGLQESVSQCSGDSMVDTGTWNNQSKAALADKPHPELRSSRFGKKIFLSKIHSRVISFISLNEHIG